MFDSSDISYQCHDNASSYSVALQITFQPISTCEELSQLKSMYTLMLALFGCTTNKKTDMNKIGALSRCSRHIHRRALKTRFRSLRLLRILLGLVCRVIWIPQKNLVRFINSDNCTCTLARDIYG